MFNIPYIKFKKNICFIDLETTGTNLNNSGIIQFGGIKTDFKFNVINSYSTYINPDYLSNMIISEDAMKINRINKDNIPTFPSFNTVKNEILDFISEDSLIVGHNITFDILFLYNAFLFSSDEKSNNLLNHVPRCLDTASLLLPLSMSGKIAKNTLLDACKYFAIDHSTPHDALNDANMTLEVFKNLLEFYSYNFSSIHK